MNSSLRSRSTFVSSLFHSAQQPAYLGLARPAASICIRRPFSQSTPRPRGGATRVVKPRMPPTMSMKNKMKEAMGQMTQESAPDDFGLLPGTFVRPLEKNLPSIFKDYKQRWLMEKTWAKNWAMGVMSVLAYCKFLNKPRLPLNYRQRKPAALELHKKMYTAFADGDTATLKQICCTGLYEDFAKRIARRSSPKLKWTLHKYITFPAAPNLTGARVIADRAASIPIGDKIGARQAVVRIRSKQSITKYAKASEEEQVVEEEKQQECTEYLVIQKMMVGGVEGQWKVWGLADETTMEEVERNPMFAPGLSLNERVQMMTMNDGKDKK